MHCVCGLVAHQISIALKQGLHCLLKTLKERGKARFLSQDTEDRKLNGKYKQEFWAATRVRNMGNVRGGILKNRKYFGSFVAHRTWCTSNSDVRLKFQIGSFLGIARVYDTDYLNL
jgi:hypothetical protein